MGFPGACVGTSACAACGAAPLARRPAISSLVNPSSFSTSSLCSPIPGARLAGTFERNDDVIRSQLRIINDFLRLTHGAEGDVNAVEDLIPMRHWLRTKDPIEYCRQLRTVLRQLGGIRESWIRQDILTT